MITLAGFEELTPVSHGVELHRYRFTTQDRGQAIEATGMLAFPAHLDDEPSEPWPVALLLHGFAGAWDACAPSADALIGPAQPALLVHKARPVRKEAQPVQLAQPVQQVLTVSTEQ